MSHVFMLAPNRSVKMEDVRFPVIASPKLDGIRAGQIENRMKSRSLKDLPNHQLQCVFPDLHREGWDGELISGPPNAPDVYNRTQSQVMSRSGGTAGLTWYVFDTFTMPTTEYLKRYLTLPEFEAGPHIKRMEQTAIYNLEQLVEYEERMVSGGYEGVMLRDPAALYRPGRSTLREGVLLKLKRFLDSEAMVINFIELEKNENELTRDERGYAKRSSHQSGKIPMNTLGALEVMWGGLTFRIGIFKGFTKLQLKQIWDERDQHMGRTLKFQYLPITKDAPRSARMVGWRDEE